MGTTEPEKPGWMERWRLKARFHRLMDKHPQIAELGHNHLLWGVVMGVLIILLLVNLEGLERKTYSLNSVVSENIIAPQDLRIPDLASTEKKREERLASLKTIYRYDDAQWRSYIAQIESLFEEGRIRIAAELARPYQPDVAMSPDFLAQSENFVRTLGQAIAESSNLSVPDNVLVPLIEDSFSVDLEEQLTFVIQRVLEQPIVNLTLYPPLSTGYILRPIEDASKDKLPIVSLSEARNQMTDEAEQALAEFDSNRQIVEWLQTLVEPTVTIDETEMRRQRNEALNVDTLYFDVKRGEVIARRGDKIADEDQLARINYILDSRFKGINLLFRAISLTFFTALFLYALHKFAVWHRRRNKISYPLFLLLSLTLAINVGLIKLAVMIGDSVAGSLLHNAQDYYWAAPFAIGSMLITLLVGTQLAALYAIILVFLSGFLFGGNFAVLIYSLIGCFVSIYGLRKYKERSALIKSGIALGLMNVITIIAINLLNEKFEPFGEMFFSLAMGFVGGLIVAIIVSFLLPIFESLFKIVTDIRLLELSNHEHPLLRSLFLNAPGTFQHSIVVGYLSEAAASEIRANSLFCRVACLYHDVGKMVKSHYYVENTDDMGRKHEKLSPHMSALIISNHVKEGIELARSYGLPESIIDIIPQHHGTRLIRYFYEKAKSQQKPDDVPVNEEEFRYPGPKPQTREAGIIMIADSVEAAARSLDDPSPGRLKGTIQEIIEATFLDGQLDECDLTLKDLTRISDAFLKVLLSMKHERIKYPGFSMQERRKTQKNQQKNREKRQEKGEKASDSEDNDTQRRSTREFRTFEESEYLDNQESRKRSQD